MGYMLFMFIIGDGDIKIVLMDNCDIGSFVVKIIVDERILNRFVFVYGDLKMMNEFWRDVESIFEMIVVKSYVCCIFDGFVFFFLGVLEFLNLKLGVWEYC